MATAGSTLDAFHAGINALIKFRIKHNARAIKKFDQVNNIDKDGEEEANINSVASRSVILKK